MATAEPVIAILMATYNPRLDWLREQLASLEGQTYRNLRLYLRDDYSEAQTFEAIKQLVAETIPFPVYITRNDENKGSNLTFEALTAEAEGEYFAYCDQDDVWLPEKLETLKKEIENTGAALVCSDMHIINAEGKQVADSITKVRRHHVFRSGEGLAEKLLVSNWVTGCTMLVKADTAKASIPFCPYMVHDHYLALYCANKGAIVALAKPLIQYRIHSTNQTSVLAGVVDKETYISIRIEPLIQRMQWLQEYFQCGEDLKREIASCLRWAQCRLNNARRQGGTRGVWAGRRFGKSFAIFELVCYRLPNRLFSQSLNLTRKHLQAEAW